MLSLLIHACRSFSHLLFPPACLHCQEEMDESFRIFCKTCQEELTLIEPKVRCPYCFSDEFDPNNESCCSTCRQKPQFLHRTAAAFDYEGPAATLIKQLKYQGQPYLAQGAGAFLAMQFLHLNWPMPDCVVPMPMARLREFERGYNQSRLLAEAVASILGCPLLDVLSRKSGDFCQAGLSYQQRMQLGSDAFSIKKDIKLHDKCILLIDDVMTTGSSLQRCAEALLELCPEHIYALTVCRAS